MAKRSLRQRLWMWRFHRQQEKDKHCHFCGKQPNEVSCLVAGPRVFICNECVEICADFVLRHYYDKAKITQDSIKDMEQNGGIPAIKGVSDQEIPTTTA